MKDPMLWLKIVPIAALGIAGFFYLNTATSGDAFTPEKARTNSLIAGIFSLTLATGLGVVLFRKRD